MGYHRWFGSATNPFREVADIAITENAIIAQTYAASIRTYAEELAKFRQLENDIIDLLMSVGRRIKRDTIRDCGDMTSFAMGSFKRTRRGNKDKTSHGKRRARETRYRKWQMKARRLAAQRLGG